LDFLRGVAAFIVALVHFSYGTITISPIAGGICVGFFFILSGFVLSHAYKTQIQNGTFGFKRYVVARIARLYPLHILTFALIALYWILMGLGKKYGLPITVEHVWTFSTVFENITLTPFWFQDRVSFNGPSWSIGIELWCSFYIFFLFMPGLKLAKAIVLGLVLVAFLFVESQGGLLHAQQHWVAGFLEKNYVTGLACFTLGWAIYGVKMVSVPVLAWLLASMIFVLTVFTPPLLIESPFSEVGFFLAFAVVIVLLVQAQPRNQRLIGVMEKCGEMSYGIYLWHVPVMLGLATVIRVIEVKTGYKIMGLPVMNFLYIGLLLPTAWISHRVIERPAQKWIKKVL